MCFASEFSAGKTAKVITDLNGKYHLTTEAHLNVLYLLEVGKCTEKYQQWCLLTISFKGNLPQLTKIVIRNELRFTDLDLN